MQLDQMLAVPGDRKLVKGPGWRPADVAGILREAERAA